jgi:putative chitinase
MVTIAQLVAAGISPTAARRFVEPLNAALDRFEITSRTQVAAFIAQASHESMGFTRLEENLYYTSAERVRKIFSGRVHDMETAARLCRNPRALADHVYANRLGNGDAASGEGWKYRGRGLFQLTGFANYYAAGAALGRPYKAEPDLVAEPIDACLTAAWYWQMRGLNKMADIDEITRAINGPAMAGASDRRQLYEEAARALA